MYELQDSDVINDNCIGEEGIDEILSTWGYLQYRVDDVKKTRIKLEEGAKAILEEVVNNVEA